MVRRKRKERIRSITESETREFRNDDAEEFEELRQLGFEFDAPADTFSMQPDSSSTIDGIRGEQEYGIAGGVSTEPGQSPETVPHRESHVISDEDGSVMSEWTMGHAMQSEDYVESSDEELERELPVSPPIERHPRRREHHHHVKS